MYRFVLLLILLPMVIADDFQDGTAEYVETDCAEEFHDKDIVDLVSWGDTFLLTVYLVNDDEGLCLYKGLRVGFTKPNVNHVYFVMRAKMGCQVIDQTLNTVVRMVGRDTIAFKLKDGRWIKVNYQFSSNLELQDPIVPSTSYTDTQPPEWYEFPILFPAKEKALVGAVNKAGESSSYVEVTSCAASEFDGEEITEFVNWDDQFMFVITTVKDGGVCQYKLLQVSYSKGIRKHFYIATKAKMSCEVDKSTLKWVVRKISPDTLVFKLSGNQCYRICYKFVESENSVLIVDQEKYECNSLPAEPLGVMPIFPLYIQPIGISNQRFETTKIETPSSPAPSPRAPPGASLPVAAVALASATGMLLYKQHNDTSTPDTEVPTPIIQPDFPPDSGRPSRFFKKGHSTVRAGRGKSNEKDQVTETAVVDIEAEQNKETVTKDAVFALPLFGGAKQPAKSDSATASVSTNATTSVSTNATTSVSTDVTTSARTEATAEVDKTTEATPDQSSIMKEGAAGSVTAEETAVVKTPPETSKTKVLPFMWWKSGTPAKSKPADSASAQTTAVTSEETSKVKTTTETSSEKSKKEEEVYDRVEVDETAVVKEATDSAVRTGNKPEDVPATVSSPVQTQDTAAAAVNVEDTTEAKKTTDQDTRDKAKIAALAAVTVAQAAELKRQSDNKKEKPWKRWMSRSHEETRPAATSGPTVTGSDSAQTTASVTAEETDSVQTATERSRVEETKSDQKKEVKSIPDEDESIEVKKETESAAATVITKTEDRTDKKLPVAANLPAQTKDSELEKVDETAEVKITSEKDTKTNETASTAVKVEETTAIGNQPLDSTKKGWFGGIALFGKTAEHSKPTDTASPTAQAAEEFKAAAEKPRDKETITEDKKQEVKTVVEKDKSIEVKQATESEAATVITKTDNKVPTDVANLPVQTKDSESAMVKVNETAEDKKTSSKGWFIAFPWLWKEKSSKNSQAADSSTPPVTDVESAALVTAQAAEEFKGAAEKSHDKESSSSVGAVSDTVVVKETTKEKTKSESSHKVDEEVKTIESQGRFWNKKPQKPAVTTPTPDLALTPGSRLTDKQGSKSDVQPATDIIPLAAASTSLVVDSTKPSSPTPPLNPPKGGWRFGKQKSSSLTTELATTPGSRMTDRQKLSEVGIIAAAHTRKRPTKPRKDSTTGGFLIGYGKKSSSAKRTSTRPPTKSRNSNPRPSPAVVSATAAAALASAYLKYHQDQTNIEEHEIANIPVLRTIPGLAFLWANLVPNYAAELVYTETTLLNKASYIPLDDTFILVLVTLRDDQHKCVFKELNIFYTNGRGQNLYFAHKIVVACTTNKKNLIDVVRKTGPNTLVMKYLGKCRRVTYRTTVDQNSVQLKRTWCGPKDLQAFRSVYVPECKDTHEFVFHGTFLLMSTEFHDEHMHCVKKELQVFYTEDKGKHLYFGTMATLSCGIDGTALKYFVKVFAADTLIFRKRDQCTQITYSLCGGVKGVERMSETCDCDTAFPTGDVTNQITENEFIEIAEEEATISASAVAMAGPRTKLPF